MWPNRVAPSIPGIRISEAASLASLQGRFTADGELHVPALPVGVQHAADAVEYLAFVVHEQHTLHADTAFVAREVPSWGRRMTKVVPAPSSVSK